MVTKLAILVKVGVEQDNLISKNTARQLPMSQAEYTEIFQCVLELMYRTMDVERLL